MIRFQVILVSFESGLLKTCNDCFSSNKTQTLELELMDSVPYEALAPKHLIPALVFPITGPVWATCSIGGWLGENSGNIELREQLLSEKEVPKGGPGFESGLEHEISHLLVELLDSVHSRRTWASGPRNKKLFLLLDQVRLYFTALQSPWICNKPKLHCNGVITIVIV